MPLDDRTEPARRLTNPPGPLEILLFDVSGVRYGIVTRDVVQVVRAVSIVPLPRAPRVIEGVIDIRGAAVAVVDIRSRFRLAPKPLSPSDHMIVARAGRRTVALRVDRVAEIRGVEEHELVEASSATFGEYVAGVATLADGLALLHDLQTFLSHAEGAELDQALPSELEDR